jgi:hypothetical protein
MNKRINKVLKTVKNCKDSIHPNSFRELIMRLTSVKSQYIKLMELNAIYLRDDSMKMEMIFNEESGEMFFAHQGKVISSLKLNRADPNVPVKLMSKSDMSSFIPEEESNDILGDINKIQKEIAKELENFYFNASKLWDLVEKTIFKKSKSEFIGVKMVRNKLIEHTEDGDIYSFGVSEEWGPSVKPSQLKNRKEKWHDKGLKVNTEELILKIDSRFILLKNNL